MFRGACKIIGNFTIVGYFNFRTNKFNKINDRSTTPVWSIREGSLKRANILYTILLEKNKIIISAHFLI